MATEVTETATGAADVPDLFRGGGFYRVLHRFGVEPTTAARTARRAAALAAFLWVPLLVLAAVDGVALPGRVAQAFLLDVAAWSRPLLVVPLLVIAEPILAAAWAKAGARFRERELVSEDLRPAYLRGVERVRHLAGHVLPDVVCLLLAGFLVVRLTVFVRAEPRDAWFALTGADGTTRLTLAGIWYATVVHVVLLFLTLRWIWLFFLWYRFLWGVSRLPLRLHPTHPDRAAGLGFLGFTLPATAPLAFAWSAGLASVVANRMIHQGASLADYVPLGVGHLVAVLLVFVLPLIGIFGPLLGRTRRLALEEWGLRMARRGDDLAAGPAPASGGSGGESSMEDLQIAVAAVRGILPLPFPLSLLVGPLVATAAPVLPLLFLAFPAQEVVDRFLDLLF